MLVEMARMATEDGLVMTLHPGVHRNHHTPTFHRFRAAVTETAGFYRGSGFIDDTRAFLSIPARHDMARRLDAGFLARLVREGRLTTAQAERVVVDLVDAIPRKAFKL
jgi:glucuronate isomerase